MSSTPCDHIEIIIMHQRPLFTLINKGRKLCTFADVQNTNPFGGMKFMARHGEHVHTGLAHINRQFADCLDGIGMKNDAPVLDFHGYYDLILFLKDSGFYIDVAPLLVLDCINKEIQ